MNADSHPSAVMVLFKNERLWAGFGAFEITPKTALFQQYFFPKLVPKSTCRSSTVFGTNPAIERRTLDSGHILDFRKAVLLSIVQLYRLA